MKDQRLDSGHDVPEPYGPECSAHHLISVDELRAAGALDMPAAWRKSLSGDSSAERDLFSGLIDADLLENAESPAADEQPPLSDVDHDGSAR